MPVVAAIIKAFTAFGNGEIVVICPCCSHIKKISSSFPGFYAFAVNAVHFLVVVFVRHFVWFDEIIVACSSKYNIVLQLPKFS